MEPKELRGKLTGVISFPVTPFNEDCSLNLAGLSDNLERILVHPIAAIIAAGGTGEMYSLTPAEHLQVVRTTVEVVRGRVPVLTGVGVNHALAAEIAREASKAGVDGILAFPPYYPQADDEGLWHYYSRIARATSLGLIIYSRDWFSPGPGTVEKLAEIPTLVAWKDGQGDMRRYQMIMHQLGDRLLWIGGAGDDLAPSYYGLGIRAYTSSIANFAPKLSLRIHKLASNGEFDMLKTLMSDFVLPHYSVRSRRRGYEVSVVKAKMDILGMAGGPVRPPLANVSEVEKNELREMLETWGPVL
jgi:5-dehydro-4-deoxyglucarate dehydratase